jgi:hypothetical protein
MPWGGGSAASHAFAVPPRPPAAGRRPRLMRNGRLKSGLPSRTNFRGAAEGVRACERAGRAPFTFRMSEPAELEGLPYVRGGLQSRGRSLGIRVSAAAELQDGVELEGAKLDRASSSSGAAKLAGARALERSTRPARSANLELAHLGDPDERPVRSGRELGSQAPAYPPEREIAGCDPGLDANVARDRDANKDAMPRGAKGDIRVSARRSVVVHPRLDTMRGVPLGPRAEKKQRLTRPPFGQVAPRVRRNVTRCAGGPTRSSGPPKRGEAVRSVSGGQPFIPNEATRKTGPESRAPPPTGDGSENNDPGLPIKESVA